MVQKLCQLYKSSGIIPLAPTKIGIIKLNDLIYLLNQTNVRKLEKKTEKGRETYMGHLPGPSPAGGPAHPRCLLSSPSSDRRTRACARRSLARAPATSPPAGHLLLPRTPSMPRTKPRSCPAPLSLSLALLFPPALSPSHPRTTAAADGHHRSHWPPLASPTRFRAPPQPPPPPR